MFVLPSLCSFVFDLCILSIRSSLVEYNNRYDLSESNNNDTNAILQGEISTFTRKRDKS